MYDENKLCMDFKMFCSKINLSSHSIFPQTFSHALELERNSPAVSLLKAGVDIFYRENKNTACISGPIKQSFYVAITSQEQHEGRGQGN